MATIPGASGFINSATLANTRGFSAGRASLIGDLTIDLLDVGRRINRFDSGLSSRARELNKRFLESSTANFNALFSLNVGTTSSIEALQTQILALRSQSLRVSRSVAELTGQTTGSQVVDDVISEERAAAEAAEASNTLSNGSNSLLSSGAGSLFNTSA